MKKKKVYLSGPITGLDREDYMERFAIAERELRKLGYKVVNPTKFLICRCPWIYMFVGYRLTLAYDIWRLMHCDKIFTLYGWNLSKGACIEFETASQMGIPDITDSFRSITDKIVQYIVYYEYSQG